jgi:hypothetical protein
LLDRAIALVSAIDAVISPFAHLFDSACEPVCVDPSQPHIITIAATSTPPSFGHLAFRARPVVVVVVFVFGRSVRSFLHDTTHHFLVLVHHSWFVLLSQSVSQSVTRICRPTAFTRLAPKKEEEERRQPFATNFGALPHSLD